jgi:Tfp pilus assembly protein PilX
MAAALVVLLALVGVAGLSVLSVQRGLNVSGAARAQTQALMAAESGIAAGAAFLRTHIAQGTNWSAYVTPLNATPQSPALIVGNNALPGTGGNPFSPTMEIWYEVTLYNNVKDPGFAAGTDDDGILIVRSVGHGPDGARVIIEVEVSATATGTADATCVGYAQQGMSELNSGRNDCLGTINSTDTATMDFGGP